MKFGLVVREMVLDAVGTLGVDMDKDLISFLRPSAPVLLMPKVGERWHRAKMTRKVIEGDSVEVGWPNASFWACFRSKFALT